jgi:serine phosphatase RsbU (regulator of sigma subunit)
VRVEIGAAKVAKYAVSESGDTLELIERPHGGLSLVLVDGQRSGRAAKLISNIVARKAVSLLGEGVRDGAVARAAHDYLRAHRGGQVSAELQVLSVDLQTNTIVVSRNCRCPAYIVRGGNLDLFDSESRPVGVYANTKPVIREFALEEELYVMVCTDGLRAAGSRHGVSLNIDDILVRGAREGITAQAMADRLLEAAVEADQGRPRDDISVVVLATVPTARRERVRRFAVTFPV